jgi:hypothetical protein
MLQASRVNPCFTRKENNMLLRTLFLASAILAAVWAVAAEQIRPADSVRVPRTVASDCRQKHGEARIGCEQQTRAQARAARDADDDRDSRWRTQQLQLALQRCDILSGSTRHACIMGSREEFLN